MKHRILFCAVGPKERTVYNSMKMYEHASIAYLASHLIDNGHEVFVETRDVDTVKYEEMDSFNPDIICLAHCVDPLVIEWVKTKKPGVIVCKGTGEWWVGTGDEHLKSEDYIDFIITGEAEAAWIKLLEAIDTGGGYENILGLAYRKGKEIIQNPGICEFDIEQLPRPYLPLCKPMATVLTARGCVGNCSFCGSRVVHPKWKGRSIESVVDEIQYLVENGIGNIHFADRTFEAPDYKCKRLTELCQAIIDRRIPILYQANFRPDFHKKTTPELMDLLVRSGLYGVFIGVEAGNQDDLDLYRKRCTLEDIKKTIALFRSYGVNIDIGFIMFNSFTTIDKLRTNLAFLEDIGQVDFDCLYSAHYAVKGTELYKKVDSVGLYDSEKKAIKYESKTISELQKFTHGYILGCLCDDDAIRRYRNAEDFRKCCLFSLNRYYRNGEQKHVEAIQEYYNKTGPVVQAVQIILANWFNKLLEINETEFNQDKSLDMSCFTLNSEFILDMAKRLERERERLLNAIKELETQLAV